jgi:hypothetical protein
VNGLVLWRRKIEKFTTLENPFGQWLHRFMVRWMVIKRFTSCNGCKNKRFAKLDVLFIMVGCVIAIFSFMRSCR